LRNRLPRRCCAAVGGKYLRRLKSRCLEGRHQAEEQPDEQRRAGAEGHETQIERERHRRRQQSLWDDRGRHLQDGRSEHQAQRAANGRQHDALGQQLANQARAIGA